MIKVYKMNGKTEAHEVFKSPSGKTIVKVTFSKGNLDPKNRVPAKFATSNPIVQAMIENDSRFNRTIFLDSVYGNFAPAVAPVTAPAAPTPAPKKGKGKAETSKAPALKEMPEVTTLADAVTVLTSEGAPAADFDGTVEGTLKIAKALGLSFPNLKAE